jgi:hypothetical protein
MEIQGFKMVEYVGPGREGPEDHHATVGSMKWTFSNNPLYGGRKVALLSGLAANVLCDTKNYQRIPADPTMTAMEWFWAEVEKRAVEVSEYLLEHYNPEAPPEKTEPPTPDVPVAPKPVVAPERAPEAKPESPAPQPEPETPPADTSVEIAPEVAEGDTESTVGSA